MRLRYVVMDQHILLNLLDFKIASLDKCVCTLQRRMHIERRLATCTPPLAGHLH
jgi:hypothetical protein